MFILNTTFVVADDMKDEIIASIRADFLEPAVRSGYFRGQRLTRVLQELEEGYTNYAAQIETSYMTEAEEWLASEGLSFFKSLHTKYGEGVVYFSTWLEDI